MKTGLAIIIALALGALAANYLLQDNGYVLIHFRGYSVEMSVPVLVFILVLIYLAVRICIHIVRAPRRLGELAAQRRQRKAGERITRGYIELGEGNFARGEKLLTKGVRDSETPLLNYLAAARAAQAQGDKQRRDNWLRMAYEQDPRATAAVLLTQAELQLANDEYETCRATLNKVLEMTPNNAEALRLKAELCVSRSDWEELQELLPKLRKQGHVASEIMDDWFVRTWCALLGDATNDPGRISALWKQLPRNLREHPQLIHARIGAMIAHGQVGEAEVITRKALDKNWSAELALIYGQLEADPAAQLRCAESWLRLRPEDPVLLLTAARLCVRNELWGKARSYFETSNAIKPSPDAWHDLGQLMLRLGEEESASKAFQQGLTLNYSGPAVLRLEDASLGDE
jgi:HemY protein